MPWVYAAISLSVLKSPPTARRPLSSASSGRGKRICSVKRNTGIRKYYLAFWAKSTEEQARDKTVVVLENRSAKIILNLFESGLTRAAHSVRELFVGIREIKGYILSGDMV